MNAPDQMVTISDALATLQDCDVFVDNYVDVVDGEDGPRPNAAMSLQVQIREAIASIERILR
jgi:hypothetical protein